MKTIRLPVLALLMAAAVLPGCGSGDPPAEGPAVVHADNGQYPASDYIEQEKGVPGGTLRVSVGTDAGTLDGHATSSANVQWMGRILFDNLVYLDEKGGLSPWLAKSWTVSADGKIYTFYLRDDVTFSDGVKFNAEAVKVNLEHMRDPATKSPLAAAYIAPYLDGKVIDEFTFQATLREPYSPFLYVLAQSWLGMESPKAIRENPKGIGEAPVGSGPFVLESYTRQQGVKFVKRADYHWAPPLIRHEGPAYLDRIELEFVAEPLIRYNALAAGQHDLSIDAPTQNAAAIRADANLKLANHIRTGNPSRGITFNTSKPPFDDARVRKGFALAVDREGIVHSTGFGEYALKADFLSSNTRFYDPAYRDVLAFNPAEANRLLDEAGWTGRDAEGWRTKDGQRLSAEIVVTESATPSAIIAAIQADVKAVGFELKIAELPAGQLTQRRNANSYQALGAGFWHTNTPDGLYIQYHGDEVTTDKRIGQNTSRLNDPQLNDWLAAARRSSDPALLKDLYGKAQQRLTELVPAVPLHESHSIIAYRSPVRGVIFDTSHNTPFLTSLWLEQGRP